MRKSQERGWNYPSSGYSVVSRAPPCLLSFSPSRQFDETRLSIQENHQNATLHLTIINTGLMDLIESSWEYPCWSIRNHPRERV
jgi:hypothetical protein